MEKKYPERKRIYALDLSRWYVYKEKNEKSTLNISFGDLSSIIWVNERTINEVNKDIRTMVMVDNTILYNIIHYFKNNMNNIKENKDKHKIDIVNYDKNTKNKILKMSFIFGKDDNGFYLGVIIPHKNSIKFPLIPNDKFSELRVYENSEQVMKNIVNEGFANLWMDSILDTLKDCLTGSIFQDKVEITKEKEESKDKIDNFEEEFNTNIETSMESENKNIENNTKEDISDDLKGFMDELESDSKDDTIDALDEFMQDEL